MSITPVSPKKTLLTTNAQRSTVHLRRRVTIAGQVVNALTQRSISGVTVQLSRQEQGNSTSVVSSTLTMADGWFYFLDLSAGKYNLEASLSEAGTRFGKHLSSFNQMTERLNQLDPTNHVDSVTVQLNDNKEYILADKTVVNYYRVRLNLVPTAIAGQVTNASGEGIQSAKVQLVGRGEPTFTFSANADPVNQSFDAIALYLLHSQFQDPQTADKKRIGFYILSGLEAFTTSAQMPLKYAVSAPGYAGEAELLPDLDLKSFALQPGELKILNFQFSSNSST
jgi:hypothetical protein